MARVIAGAAPEQRSRAMIMAAVLFAAIAGVLVYVALQERDGGSGGVSTSAATADAVVAAHRIPANTRLTADMLAVKAISVDSLLDGAYTSMEGLIGLPTRFPVEAGAQITPLKVGLSAIDDEKDLALVLEPGKRGFAVEVTEVTGVGGLLLPGNFVDVIAVFPEGPGRRSGFGQDAGLEDIKAVTLLQNVEVLAVAQEAQEPIPALASDTENAGSGEPGGGLSGRRPDDVERQPDARSVTLAVTPQETQILALVQETGGIIWLSLRPIGDNESAPAGEANLLPLLSPPSSESGQE